MLVFMYYLMIYHAQVIKVLMECAKYYSKKYLRIQFLKIVGTSHGVYFGFKQGKEPFSKIH